MEEAREPSRQEIHGNQNATSMYGDAHVDIHLPPLSSELPERVWMVPSRRNSFFTGRETLLTALHERFLTDRSAVLTQGQAISGLGGIGKTQVAVEYAYRYREEYRFVLWANASTPETLLAAYVSIANQLRLPERAEREQDKVVAAVLHWLATHEDWLLILDNADELESVWPWLPTGSTGHVMLTTRDQLVGDLQSFVVEEMDREEGTLLLLRRVQILKAGMKVEQVSLADRQVAEQMVAEMGGLPLALDQAGAYLKATGSSLSTYQQLYQQRRVQLLAQRRGMEHPEPVATTWDIAFRKVGQQNPAATDLLRLCAHLSPDAIPETIITEGASHLGALLAPVGADPYLLNQAIEVLLAYSLVRREASSDAGTLLWVHRLVQAVLRDQMEEQSRQQWAQRAVSAVNAAFPFVEYHTWPQCERLLPHALLCATWIELEQITVPAATRLLNQTGFYLAERARYAEAEPLYQRALAIREQHLGPLHPDTAISLNNLAELYDTQGKSGQAEPLYVRALAIFEQLLGPLHPNTAQSLNNLADLYETQGKYERAEPLYQRALAINEQQLGPEHPNTASSLYNLAGLYWTQGQYEQAEPLLERALAIREQHLGEAHPDTASSLNGLALLYKIQGKYERAEPLYQRALAIREQQLGPLHPDTATSLNNLASLYQDQGKYEQAEPLYQRALAIEEQRLGHQHSGTQVTRKNYASLLRTMGRNAEAAALEATSTSPSSPAQ